MVMGSPMLMMAGITKAVWFNSGVGIKGYDNFSDAFAEINLGLFPTVGIIHVEGFYAGGETDLILSFYYDAWKAYLTTSIKCIIGPSSIQVPTHQFCGSPHPWSS